MRRARAAGSLQAMTMARTAGRLHAWLFARSGGRLGGRMGGKPVLLLTTTGRRSGLPRRTPVQYERVGEDLVLLASAGGAPRPPAWWRNLTADPAVRVQLDGRVTPATARTAAGEERERLWALLCQHDPRLPRIQAKAARELPVVIVHPQ